MMTNGDPEGRIFLSYPHTNIVFFFLLTTVFSLGPVVNILAIFSNANILKKLENKNIPHQRYGLSVIDFD